MDFLKKGANALSNNQNSGVGAATGDNNNSGTTGTGTTGTTGGTQDYGDKGMLCLFIHILLTKERGKEEGWDRRRDEVKGYMLMI